MHAFVRWSAVTLMATATTLALAETPEAAKSLLDSAIGEVKASNADKAATAFNAGGRWNKGSLYVVMVQFDGTMVAHSANPKMPGKNMLEAKDASGRPFVKEAIAAVKGPGSGEIPLRWGNPETKQIADATMFVKRVPGQDYYVGTVVFK